MNNREKLAATQGQRTRKEQDGRLMDYGALIGLGLSLGAGVGVALDQLPMGMALGLLAATIVELVQERKEGKRGADIGLVIAAIGLAIVLALWVLL